MEDFITSSNGTNSVEENGSNLPIKTHRLQQSMSDLKSEVNYLSHKANSSSCMESTSGRVYKQERKLSIGGQQTSQDKTPIKPSPSSKSLHRRSQSLVIEEKDGFIEEMRRNSEEFDKILNEIFTLELEDELQGHYDDHMPAVYVQKPINKKRKWLRKLLSFSKKPLIDDNYHLQKSSSMEAIFHNPNNVNNNTIRRESFDVMPNQHNNERSVFIVRNTNKEKPSIVDPVSNYFEQDFTTHNNEPSQDEESIIELGDKPFYQPTTRVDNETIQSHAMKLELEHFYDKKNGQILGIGMPFMVVKETGTNNICLGLQGPKRMDSSVIIDSLLILLGSFIFPPLLLISIPFAIYKIYAYYKKKKQEEKISRYLVFDNHTCRIEKRLYTSGNRTICYRGIIPKEADISSPVPNRVTYYHESSPENTLVYRNIPIAKLSHTEEKIHFIDFCDISSFDIEKEGNGNDFDDLYFVCCVLQNGKRIRLNNEETNSIDISYRKVRQLKAALEKSKMSAKANLTSRGKNCAKRKKNSMSMRNLDKLDEQPIEDGYPLRRSISWNAAN